MGFTSRQVLLFLATVSLYITFGLAIHCWDCQSNINPACGEPFNNASFDKVDCNQLPMAHLGTGKATICRKITQKIQENPVARVIRKCGWIEDENTDGQCVRRTGTFSILIEYCSCRGDGCNGATGLSLSLLTIVPTFVAMALYSSGISWRV